MKRTQKDRRCVVASPLVLPYSATDDAHIPHIQRPDGFGHRRYRGDELAPISFNGRHRAYRQSSASRRLCRFGRLGPFGLAKTLGRMDISDLSHIGHWYRNRSTSHESGSHGVFGRHSRQFNRCRASSYSLSYFLDTTPPLRRRLPCAA